MIGTIIGRSLTELDTGVTDNRLEMQSNPLETASPGIWKYTLASVQAGI